MLLQQFTVYEGKNTIPYFEVKGYSIIFTLFLLAVMLYILLLIFVPYYKPKSEDLSLARIATCFGSLIIFCLYIGMLFYFPLRALMWKYIKNKMNKDKFYLKKRYDNYTATAVAQQIYVLFPKPQKHSLLLILYRNDFYLYEKVY